MIEHKNIHEAINAVMQEVGYVKKSRAANLNYSFAGEAALISALRPAMVENGIYMAVEEIKKVTRENYTTKSGTAMVNTLLEAVVRLTHAPSGTFILVTALGEGSDAGDKSANKAMTGAYKYAMRQTFCIETGDDPDKYAIEEREPKPEEADTRHSKVTKRWDELWREAQTLGVIIEPLAPKMTDEEIVERGKELAALIKTAKENK